MRFAPISAAWLLAIATLSGCRMSGVDHLSKPAPIASATSVEVSDLIAEHNRNAERIQSLEARPSLVVTARKKNYPVSGRLALERPRNFKLDIYSHTIGDVADIGSNDEKFWFWVRDSKDRAVYYCNYDESGNTPLVASLQPDWIVEALGLRIITAAEAKEIQLSRGDEPGTVVLTHHATEAGGETVIRRTIVWEANRRIKEHQLLSDKKVLLARATIEGYQSFPVAGTAASTADAGATAAEGQTVLVPSKLKLEWLRENLAMDVTLQPKTVNATFDEKRRRSLFAEQSRKGYARVNLGEVAGRTNPDPGTTIRESRPSPPAGVELGEPTPVGVDDSARTGRDPVALSADLPPIEPLVGPAMPRAPELQFARQPTDSGWRSSAGPSFER